MIFKFIFRFFKLKKKSEFIFNFFNYVDCHVSKVVQSATATWRITCQVRHEVGSGIFFKQFFFTGMYFKVFFLQGRKSKLIQITGMIIIFKPTIYIVRNIETLIYHNNRNGIIATL